MFKNEHAIDLNNDEIIEKIKLYLLSKENIVCAYIFGSFGTENFDSESDIDIAILSSKDLSYSNILELNSELEEIVGVKIDLNNLISLPEYIQIQVIMRNFELFCIDEYKHDSYLNRLNSWIKAEYPFWKKVMMEG